MGAPNGNRFWEKRYKHGVDKLFSSPEELWNAAVSYFEWVEDNPIKEAIVYQGVLSSDEKPIMQAMTIEGLCLHLGITMQTLLNYGSKEGYEDFFEVVRKIKQVIYQQKFTGAAAGILNPNIIARDLGLAERVDNTSSDGSMSPSQISDEELKAELEKYGIKQPDS